MRVLHFAPTLHLPGGIRSYVLGLASEQNRRDVEAAVAAPIIQPGDDARELGLADAVRRFRPDVVHLHGRDVLPGGEWPGVPVVSTVHGHELYCPTGTKWSPSLGSCQIGASTLACSANIAVHKCGSRRPWKAVEAFKGFHRLRDQRRTSIQHCISEYVAANTARSGLGAATTRVIYAAVPDPSRSPTPDPEAPLLFVGRLQPNKGLEVVLRALAVTRSGATLKVVGDGTERGRLERLVPRLGLSGRVSFSGWLPPADMSEVMSRTACLLVPSQWPEPAGLVAMEAASHGVAALVSDRGGLPEMVARPDQVVGSPDSPSAWAEQIDRIVLDPAWSADRGRAGRALWAERMDPAVVIPQFSSLYREALAGS